MLEWLRLGKTALEKISLIVGCAVRTVEKYIANLCRKIGVKRREAIILGSP